MNAGWKYKDWYHQDHIGHTRCQVSFLALVRLIQTGQEPDTELGAGEKRPVEGHIPGGQHDLGMKGVRDYLYQISMCTSINIEGVPDGNIP